MPSAEQICLGLQATAEGFLWLAVIQHALLLIVLVLLWKLRARFGRMVSLYVTLTFALVSFMAISQAGNPFTGIVFAILALLGVRELLWPRMDYSLKDTLTLQIIIAAVAGFVGFWYPHFIDNKLLALVASPYGLIPCPTLLVCLAIFLLVYPHTNRIWHWCLTIVALYYSLTGVLRLKVNIDIVLLLLSIYSLFALAVLGARKRPLGRPAV